jgi:uncharacterized protein (TIGR03086 family)
MSTLSTPAVQPTTVTPSTPPAQPDLADRPALPDPRPAYRVTLDWVAQLIDQVTPDQLGLPTPCSEWNVHDLLSHLVGVAHRVAVIGRGGHPFSIPSRIEAGPDADWSALWREATDEVWSVWSDDAVLGRTLTVPPGLEVPGALALAHYVTEHLTHGWDLATAVGRRAEGPAEVAEVALAAARTHIPADGREPPFPFGPVQEPPAGAGPTARLAAWLGRP